jgi:4-amino-4-deoxy-L-arabinose transferase-like glycosyltransferase
MNPPPRTVEHAEADDDAGAHAPRKSGKLYPLILFAAVFAALFLTHLPLLSLPYFWDELGYFIPAAHDIYTGGDFVPHSTLSNAHPPLVMAYLALAWKLFGDHIFVARTAMILVSTLMLLGVFRLAERVANRQVAIAAILCTALYPVFFAQSSLAHLDMTAAAFTIWGLVFYLPRRADDAGARACENAGDGKPSAQGETDARRLVSVALFALAALAKETAILTPLTLFAWELSCMFAGKRSERASVFCLEPRRPLRRSFLLLLALVPLALWFAYHRSRTGYVFGNPEYFRYNVESTVNLSRIFEALWGRLKHVTFHMNLYVLTIAAAVSMFFRARRDEGVERRRIDVPVQIVFAVLILAHVTALSIVGGAILARYMLPVLPLVVLVCVSTVWRRVRHWPLVIVAVCAAFVYGTLVNPPYSFPWEDNLTYRDFVLLHRDAARFVADKYPEARVLTTWPATDELQNPLSGYLGRPLKVLAVENLKRETLQRAALKKSEYDIAFLFTTHGGPTLEESARLLGGHIVFREERNGQWVGVVENRNGK